jgi:hypothetical protein
MYAASTPPAGRNSLAISDQVADWLKRITPAAGCSTARYAVTLTLDVEHMHRKCRSGALTSEEEVAFAKDTFSAFRWNLDRAILKSAASRHGRELAYVPVIEGQSSGDRIHYHCVIVTPTWVTLQDMKAAVKHAWSRTQFGAHQLDVQPMRDDGWLQYMSKEAWTLHRDAVDIDNVRLSTRPQCC